MLKEQAVITRHFHRRFEKLTRNATFPLQSLMARLLHSVRSARLLWHPEDIDVRVRLYEVGERCGTVHCLDVLPIAISTTTLGELCTGPYDRSEARCVLAEDRGNLVIEACDQAEGVFLNDMPIEHGGLMPGDSLRVGQHDLLVSYERTTATPPPPSRFRLACRQPPQLT